MPTRTHLTVWDTVTQMSVASFVMLAVLALTIQLVLIIVPLKWFQLRRIRLAERGFEAAVRTAFSRTELDALAIAHPHAPGARVLSAILAIPQAEKPSTDELRGYARCAIGLEQDNFERLLPTLATIAGTAPLMGLFGTVWGIIEAFLAISTERSSELYIIAPAMSSALLTTALGLLAAMPASIAFHYAEAQVASLVDRLDSLSLSWAGRLSR